MKKLRTLPFLFLLFILSACSKKNDDRPEPVKYGPLTDFLYLPTKDAVWKIHVQGAIIGWEGYYSSQEPYTYDTSIHGYFEMRTTGIDSIIDQKVYHKFIYDKAIVFTRAPEANWSYKGAVIYFREDPEEQKVYMWQGGNPSEDLVVVDFSIGNIGDRASVSDHAPVSHINKIDSLLINKQFAKAWQATYDYNKFKSFFYKSYGIGGQTGFLNKYEIWEGAQPVSLDFTYKNDHKHFDFDFNP